MEADAMVTLQQGILVLACLYSIILAAFRHSTKEEISLIDSVLEVGVHSLAAVLSFFLFNNEVVSTSLCVLPSVLALVMIIHSYSKYVSGRKYEFVDLSTKVYIVTGSNTGIGFETAKALVAMHATVILACRTESKALIAKDTIVKELGCPPTKVIVLALDLSDFLSVRKFAGDFKALGFPLHGLINNAGLMMNERCTTKAGLEMVITANHLGHFLLTNLLLPELSKTNGRIVVLSSALHRLAENYDFDDMMAEKSYSLFGTYAQSKLANVMFAMELQKRLSISKSGVTCNTVHPGIVRTEVTRNMSAFLRIGDMIATPFMMAIQKTPSQGAYCSVYAATAPELEGVGGRYLFNCKDGILNPIAMAGETSARLWEESEKIINSVSNTKTSY